MDILAIKIKFHAIKQKWEHDNSYSDYSILTFFFTCYDTTQFESLSHKVITTRNLEVWRLRTLLYCLMTREQALTLSYIILNKYSTYKYGMWKVQKKSRI